MWTPVLEPDENTAKYGKNLILSPIFSCPQFACSNVLQTFKTRSPHQVPLFFSSLLILLPLCQLSHFYPCRGIKKHSFLMLAPPLVTCQRAVIVQSIGTEVCVCRRCSAQRLSSPCNREESNQPLTAPASSSCSKAEERGPHQSPKVLLGERSAARPLSEAHFILDRHTLSHKHGLLCSFWISPMLICPSSSFSRNQTILFLLLSSPPPPTPCFPSNLSLHALSTELSFLFFFFLASRLLLRTPSAYDW